MEMRARAVGVGLAILILGLVFFLVPITGQSVGSYTYYSGTTTPYDFFEPSLTPGTLTFHVDAFAATTVTISVYSCGSDTSCSGGSTYQTTKDLVAQASGADPSLTFTGASGTGYEVYSSASSSIDVSYDGPLFGGFFGAAFAVLGALLLVGGLLAKPLKRGAPGGPKATPTLRSSGGVIPASALPPTPPSPAPGRGAGISGYSGTPGEPYAPPPK